MVPEEESIRKKPDAVIALPERSADFKRPASPPSTG